MGLKLMIFLSKCPKYYTKKAFVIWLVLAQLTCTRCFLNRETAKVFLFCSASPSPPSSMESGERFLDRSISHSVKNPFEGARSKLLVQTELCLSSRNIYLPHFYNSFSIISIKIELKPVQQNSHIIRSYYKIYCN